MHRYKNSLYIILLGSVLFFPFLGNSHLLDWDEINFAEASREMLLSGNYTQTQIDFQEFWEKPPLFFWMQAISMKIFGINEYAARFPNAVCGIVTLLILFSIGSRLKNKEFAWLWVLCYVASILPHFYFKSGIIDPWFNLFIFLGICFFIKYIENNRAIKFLLLSAFALGLAVLTKGPVAVIIIGLTVMIYYIRVRFRTFPSLLHILYFIGAFILTILPWIGIEIAKNGTWFISEFMRYQLRLATTEDASHGGFFGYHFVVILLFCFPASVFAIRSFIHKPIDDVTVINFRKWMLILFWVVMILFSIVQTKIAHYSSMAYFPLTFLAAYNLYRFKNQLKKWELGIMFFIGILITVCVAAIPLLLSNPDILLPYIKDVFTKQALLADVDWSGWEFLIASILFIGLITAVYFLTKSLQRKAILFVFFATLLMINIGITILVPKIERYSQGAMIDFLKENAKENCYQDVIGFKSYAHLFYGERKESDNKNPIFLNWQKQQYPAKDYDAITKRKHFSEWLLTGNTDKPVYFVTNVRKADTYRSMPGLIFLYEKNGFVFFKKK